MTSFRAITTRMRAGLGAALDMAGVVLLAWLAWRVLFTSGESFQGMALTVGVIGIAAALAAGQRSVQTVPVALAGYSVLALVSAAWHRWDTVDSWHLFEPAAHLAVMVAFVVGVAYLLRTTWRLSLMSIVLTGSACVLAGQTLFDYTISGYEGQPMLQITVPSVAQWKGLHDLTFVLGLGVPLALAPAVVLRKWWLMVSGLLLAALPILASYRINSRGGTASMIAVAGAMTIATLGGARFVKALPALLAAVAAFLGAGVAVALFGYGNSQALWTVGGRVELWEGAASLVRQHPWLGVGPGNFFTAGVAAGWGATHLNAHNLPLHVAAEVGVAAAVLVVVYLGSILRTCRRAWMSGVCAMASAGVFFALVLLAIRWTTDTFVEGSILAERHRLLAWTIFAAALAIDQLYRARPLAAGQVPVRGDRVARWLMSASVVALVALEIHTLFVSREGTFQIEGERPYKVESFAAGEPVRQAFLMQGSGLRGIRILVDAPGRQTLPVQWKLWRGHPDEPGLTLAFDGTTTVEVSRGRRWVEFSFPRDGSSNDRWYTFEVALDRAPDGEPAGSPVALVASQDNPARGGVLWVGQKREAGSLFIRADRRGRTLYTRFQMEAVPKLPKALRFEAVHWVVFLAWHVAFFVYARAVLRDGWLR